MTRELANRGLLWACGVLCIWPLIVWFVGDRLLKRLRIYGLAGLIPDFLKGHPDDKVR